MFILPINVVHNRISGNFHCCPVGEFLPVLQFATELFALLIKLKYCACTRAHYAAGKMQM